MEVKAHTMNGRLIGLALLQELAEKYILVETRSGAPRNRIYARLSEITIPPGVSYEFGKNYLSPADAAKAVLITFDAGLGHQAITGLFPEEADVRTRDQLVERIKETLAPYRLQIINIGTNKNAGEIMIEDIFRATGIFMKALAGDNLKTEELSDAVRLLALPNERLRYTGPSKLPRHSHSHCDDVLRWSPKERCEMFVDGIRYGVEKREGTAPAQSAYRIAQMFVDDLYSSEEKTLWLEVLGEYRTEHKLQHP